MSLGGGSRINGFTVTVAVILVVYSILAGGLIATFEYQDFVNPYGGINFDWDYAKDFSDSDYENITQPDWWQTSEVELIDVDPNVKGLWGGGGGLTDQNFAFYRKGGDWWNSWYYYLMTPVRVTLSEVLENVDYETESSHFVYNIGQESETHVFFYPQFYVDGGELIYIYDTLEESIDNGELTILVGVNATYGEYDVFSIFGVLTGFDMYSGTPTEVNILISAVFWVLVLLLIVKLFVG